MSVTGQANFRCKTMAALLAATALVGAASPAMAESSDNSFWIRGGVFKANVDSDLRIGTPGGNVGTEVDMESDLGLDKKETLASASIGMQFSKRWHVAADYYSLSRNGSLSVAHDIVVDDVTYPASATVTTGFNSDIYRLTVGYDVVHTDSARVGLAIGAHVTDFDVSIEGVGSVGGQTAATQVRHRKILAPLPTVGIYGSIDVMPKLVVAGRVDYLSLKVNDYRGRLLNSEVGAMYRITDNIAVGAGYRIVRYRLNVERDNWEGRIGYRFKGPAAFVEFSF